MSEQETMRLVAEVVDKYSGPLKGMMEQLKRIGDGSKSIHDKGAKNVNEHAQKYKELGEQIRKVKDNGLNILNPSLAAMGVTVYGLSEGMGKLIETLKGAGDRWVTLNEEVKRGGVSARYINIYTRTFEQLGLNARKAGDGIAYIGETWDKLKSGDPKEMERLTGVFSNMLPFIDNLMKGAKNREEATSRIMGAIVDESIPLWQRRALAEAFHVDPGLASKNGKEYGAALRDAVERELAHPVDLGLFKQLHDAFAHLGQAQRDYQTDFISIFGPPGVRMVEGFASSLDAVGKKYREAFGGHGNVPFGRDSIFGRAASALGFKTRDNQSANERVAGAFDALTKKEHEETVARGTARGVIEAFREWMSSRTEAQQFAEGLRPMAYHPDGGGGQGAGGAARFGSKQYPLITSGGGAFSAGGGNTRGDRNNNPGNLKFGPLAQSFGATHADDRGFAVFPNRASGEAAQEALIKSDRYKGLTLRQFSQKYAEGSSDWMGTVGRGLGIGPNDVVNNQDPRLADAIRRAEGTLGGSMDRGLGRANFMRGQFGGPGENITTVRTAGGHTFTANAMSAPHLKGFVEDLERAGAPIKSIGGFNKRNIAGTNKWSQHAYGNAIDIDQFSRGETSRALAEWARSNPDKLNDAVKRWGIVNGASFGDWGHFEWGGVSGIHGAQLRDMARRGSRSPRDSELLRRGLRGDAGGLNGSLGVKIDLNGFPKGTKVSTSQEGGLLKEVALRRGSSMPLASETS